jgi:hypothetical protein
MYNSLPLLLAQRSTVPASPLSPRLRAVPGWYRLGRTAGITTLIPPASVRDSDSLLIKTGLHIPVPDIPNTQTTNFCLLFSQ